MSKLSLQSFSNKSSWVIKQCCSSLTASPPDWCAPWWSGGKLNRNISWWDSCWPSYFRISITRPKALLTSIRVTSNAYLFTERSLTWFRSLRTSSMEGIPLTPKSWGLSWPLSKSFLFLLRWWISSNADEVSVEELAQGRGGGGGGGGGGAHRGVEVNAGAWRDITGMPWMRKKRSQLLYVVRTFVCFVMSWDTKNVYLRLEQQLQSWLSVLLVWATRSPAL